MPKISVILPVYNSAKFLPEALDSILAQTFRDFELLIIFDKSSDNSQEIIEKYKTKDNRIVIIKNQPGTGLVGALNLGFKKAKGDYLARMDADDVSLPKRFQKQVAFMDSHPEFAACGAWGQTIGPDKNEVWKCPDNPMLLKCKLMFENSCIHTAMFLRKSLIQKNDLFYDPKFKETEDYDLWARISRKFPIKNLPEVLVYHRLHPDSKGFLAGLNCSSYADLVRKKLLDELGLTLTKTEQKTFNTLVAWDYDNTPNFLAEVDRLFVRMQKQNQQKKIYTPVILTKMLTDRWAGILLIGKQKGYKFISQTWRVSYLPFIKKILLISKVVLLGLINRTKNVFILSPYKK